MFINPAAATNFQKRSLFWLHLQLLLNVYQKMVAMQSVPETDISTALLRSMIKYFGR